MPKSADENAGNAYGRGPQTHDAELTEVGPGTPCGEFMRRYWHPIALSENVDDRAAERPHPGRGSDPVPRSAKAGRACSIRAARIAARRSITARSRTTASAAAITAGCSTCKATASISPASRTAARTATVRQPWYPVEELYGLVWAYMGPPEKKPVLPRWDMLENLGPDEMIHVTGSSLGAGGDDTVEIVPCNWLQRLGKHHGPVPCPDPAHDASAACSSCRNWRHADGQLGACRATACATSPIASSTTDARWIASPRRSSRMRASCPTSA